SIELAERLTAIASGNLQHVFFTNSGSEANDTVVKLVWYFNNALGRVKKKKIISRINAYHGITIASGSLTGLPRNHRDFDLPIADEVITGFGRTGRMFGCETFDITPDFVVLSKQLTSAYQPLSAILFSDAVYNVVADNTAKVGTFGHGFTAGGHPVATAVAL